CTIVYTSGTTGDPKGAELAHRNLVDVTRAVIKVHPIGGADYTLSWLPYSHVFERINGTMTILTIGGQMWLSHGVDRLAEDLAEVQPTILLSVPRVYEKMHSRVMDRVREAPGFRRGLFNWAIGVGTRFSHEAKPGPILKAEHSLAERLVLGPLRHRLVGGRLRFFISGGAALAREIEEFFWAIGVPILNGWGMTETSSGACSNTLTDHRFLTVGKPFPGIELKIEADGEILVNSPGNMLGYHKNPVATAETLDHGWIRTGDIGEVDADGFLKITDRKKDLIKTAVGKYVAPQQLEFEIQRDDLVEQAVVIGESKPYVTALIVPDWAAVTKRIPGRPEDLVKDPRVIALIDQAVDAVNKRVGSWEAIKYFTLLPRAFTEEAGEITPTLKIKRKVVAQKYADQIESMYAHKK
ncbi:MAG TPA: AMP-dependent synthetase/ligase, partial [Candidatus Dormibacteraeota bacterium]